MEQEEDYDINGSQGDQDTGVPPIDRTHLNPVFQTTSVFEVHHSLAFYLTLQKLGI